jgi:hypothetical protein
MMKVDGVAFYNALSWLRSIQATVEHGIAKDFKNAVLKDVKGSTKKEDGKVLIQDLIDSATGLAKELKTIGARVTEMAVQSLLHSLKEGEATFGSVAKFAEEIDTTIKRELNLVTLFALDTDQAKLFESDTPLFGPAVADKFPSAAFEIDEAGKCLAIKRATAGVFHLMRVTEIAIGAIRKSLNIPDPIKASARNWGAILRSIKTEMERRDNPSTWKSNEDRDFFDGSYACLDAVKGAWRNTTMHIENKYNDEEAYDIFVAVRALMRKLSVRLDESGNPLA